MTRTLVVTNDFPPRQGGIQTFVAALLARRPPESVVVLASDSPGSAAYDAGLPYPVVRRPTSMLLPTRATARAAVDLAGRFGCDSAFFGAAAPLGLIAPALRAAGVGHMVGATHGHETGWVALPGSRQLLQRIAGDLDVLTGTLTGALGAAAGVAALGWLVSIGPLRRRSGAESPGDPRIVALVLFLLAVGTLVSTPVQNLVSRQIEARADVHALDLTRDPDAFMAMQRELAVANLAEPDPPAALQWFFGSHPTTAQRIGLARDWERLERP